MQESYRTADSQRYFKNFNVNKEARNVHGNDEFTNFNKILWILKWPDFYYPS